MRFPLKALKNASKMIYHILRHIMYKNNNSTEKGQQQKDIIKVVAEKVHGFTTVCKCRLRLTKTAPLRLASLIYRAAIRARGQKIPITISTMATNMATL